MKTSLVSASALLALGAIAPVMAKSPSQYVATTSFGPDAYTVPAAFPTSEFPSMDFMPKSQEAEPRPVITRVDGGKFEDSLVNPTQLPNMASASEAVFPLATQSAQAAANNTNFREQALTNFTNLLNDKGQSDCQKCRLALQLGQRVVQGAPSLGPALMVQLCQQYNYTTTPTVKIGCENKYGASALGAVLTQVLSYSNFTDDSPTLDYLCAMQVTSQPCPIPQQDVFTPEFLSDWFKGKPVPPPEIESRSKKTGKKQDKPLRALHVSDFHVDPRYVVDSEAACSGYPCCRADSYNSTLWSKPVFDVGTLPKENISEPANYWGHYQCDPPWGLVAAGMQGISGITEKDGALDFGVFTGDLTTHDATNHISRDLVKYAEQSLFDMFHRHMGNATMVVALGNHDTSPSDQTAPAGLPDGRGDQFSWNYENVASLVKSEGWGNDSTAESIRSHYAGYSVSPRQGFRIIALNSDMWYKGNFFAYMNLSNPDQSGMLRWFTDQLQEAEDRNERVWVVAHVLTGWNGGDALDNPSNLIYHIVSRYSNTIAHLFFGHSHEDMFQLYYNATNGNSTSASRKSADVKAHAFVGPSLTPLTNVQPSLRIYEVDPETYEVMDYHQYFTPISDFKNATSQGPIWHELYSARETYSNLSAAQQAGTYAAPVALENGMWPKSAPLNASFWAAVTDEMEQRPELVELHHLYQGRNSPRSPACNTDECHKAKVCYMRSGSSSLGRACPKGYGSVQSAFDV